jgi:hypothetical protein
MEDEDELIIQAYNLGRESKDEIEERVLSRFLWYLNSGGRRHWIVKDRPDKKDNSIPRPDFTCVEQSFGDEKNVEITYVSGVKEGKKYEIERQNLLLAAVEIADLITKKVKIKPTGMYVSKTTMCRDPRHRSDLHSVVNKFIEEYEGGNLSSFNKVTKTISVFLVYPSPNILQYWDPNPLNTPGLAGYDVLKNNIHSSLNEANKKLSNCKNGILLVFMDLVDLEEYEILSACETHKENYPNVGGFYILSTLNTCLQRIW